MEIKACTAEIVPPPAKIPVQKRAQELGLPDGLRVDSQVRSGWRCDQCDRMQHSGTELVWVPDGVKLSDPIWSVTEIARQNAFNGSWSGWCLSCARKLGHAGPGIGVGWFLAAVFVFICLVGLMQH